MQIEINRTRLGALGSGLRNVAALVAAGSLASGCATTSFAPPPVNMSKPMMAGTGQKCIELAGSDLDFQVSRNIDAAARLTDNFLLAYRCAQREAANGRQMFEIPSMLALTAAALGPTFGFSDELRIGLTGGSALAGRGNTYFAPKEKAGILNSAIDAVLCIKTESVGVSFFETTPPAAIELAEARLKALKDWKAESDKRLAELDSKIRTAESAPEGSEARKPLAKLQAERLQEVELGKRIDQLIAGQQQTVDGLRGSSRMGLLDFEGGGGSVTIPAQRQYYEMVSAALFGVERVLADRLSNAGQFDPAGVTAELEKLVKLRDEADANKKPVAEALAAARRDPKAALAFVATQQEDVVTLGLASLQPRLQICVTRAKMK